MVTRDNLTNPTDIFEPEDARLWEVHKAGIEKFLFDSPCSPFFCLKELEHYKADRKLVRGNPEKKNQKLYLGYLTFKIKNALNVDQSQAIRAALGPSNFQDKDLDALCALIARLLHDTYEKLIDVT